MSAWPRPKQCLADRGGKHRWRYAEDRSSRTCQKCGTVQHPKDRPKSGLPADDAHRNVRCTVEIDMCVPDMSSAPVADRFKGDPGYVAYQATQLDDESHERIQSLVHAIIERGDPDDAYDMTVVVSARLIP